MGAVATSAAYAKGNVLLAVDHVTLRYGDRLILNDVCAEIRDITRPDCVQGQVVCFLGPSGIGKTQLSRVIAGLQTPTEGRVLVPDPVSWPVGLMPVRKGMVGMVPQTYPLFEFATVRDNLLLAGRQGLVSISAADVKAQQLSVAFGLQQFCDLYPRQLSGGTRQRVAIARQLMCAGHFIVMDEPFSGLDLINKQRACEVITHVANLDELNTIIVVTHDVTEGLGIADTVWLMGPAPGGGATLVEQYDMAAEDLCWHPELQQEPRFQRFVADVKARFRALA